MTKTILTINQTTNNVYGNPRFKVVFLDTPNKDYLSKLRKKFDIRKVRNSSHIYTITTFLNKDQLMEQLNTL